MARLRSSTVTDSVPAVLAAVEVEGEVSEPSWREKTRLSLPPHSPTSNRRLSCQTQVLGDIKVTNMRRLMGPRF